MKGWNEVISATKFRDDGEETTYLDDNHFQNRKTIGTLGIHFIFSIGHNFFVRRDTKKQIITGNQNATKKMIFASSQSARRGSGGVLAFEEDLKLKLASAMPEYSIG